VETEYALRTELAPASSRQGESIPNPSNTHHAILKLVKPPYELSDPFLKLTRGLRCGNLLYTMSNSDRFESDDISRDFSLFEQAKLHHPFCGY
jgi:hypothetical protein